jgi:hypothetical protein
MRPATLALLSLLIASAAMAANHSVVPGVSVGDIKIGMTRENIYHVLGAPNSGRTAAEGKGIARDIWEEGKAENFLFVYLYQKQGDSDLFHVSGLRDAGWNHDEDAVL